MLRRLIDWLTLRDIKRELKALDLSIQMRQARGNVLLQQGRIMTREDLDRLAEAADETLRELGALDRHVRHLQTG